MAARRPAYDENDRERIRRGLSQYKEHHDIGVPTLQLRIAEVIDDEPDRIPLKSLQRFLAGTHRTDDSLVDHCARFLLTVAPPPPESQFTDMVSQFLITIPAQAPDFEDVRGTYYSFVAAEDPADKSTVWTPYSVLTLEKADAPHYLNASERMINTDRSPEFHKYGLEIFDPERNIKPLLYSGVLLQYKPPTYLLFVRSYFSMRYCLLLSSRPEGDQEHDNLHGSALEPLTVSDRLLPHRITADFRIRYTARQNLRKTHD